jgi:hypothetical protein
MDAFLLSGGDAYPVGDLPPGDSTRTIRRDRAIDTSQAALRSDDLVQASGRDAPLKRELLQDLLRNGPLSLARRGSGAVLAGWLEKDPTPVRELPDFFRSASLAIVLVTLHSEGPDHAEP